MLQVGINQTFGRIGIEQTWASTQMKVQPADFRLTTKPAAVKITKDWPAVNIDQTETRASMGYRNIVAFQKDIAQKGQVTALAGINNIAREGDRMGRIEAGGNPIPAIAEASAWPEKDFNITMIPKTPPDISYTGSLDIKVVPGDVAVDSEARFPQTSVIKGSLNVYVRVKPAVDIDVTGQWIDLLG
ncbi:MAG: DUF6470 family protein [Bacillota bacterium]